MGPGARRLVRSLGISALVALVVAGAFACTGLSEAGRCCPPTPLSRITGTVALVAFRDAGRGLYPALVAERILEIRIRGNRTRFRYDNGWPDIGRLRRTIRHGDSVEMGYANCGRSLVGFRQCDIFEIAVAGGAYLATAEEVIAARDRNARMQFLLAAMFASVAALLGSVWGYGVSRGTAPEPS